MVRRRGRKMQGRSSGIVRDALKNNVYSTETEFYTKEVVLRLERYISELLRWSKSMHIVGRADATLNLTRQLGDSIGLLRFADLCGRGAKGAKGENGGDVERRKWRRVADIGSGAGFPGLVWKIIRPSLEATLFERRERMSTLLINIRSRLGIEGLEIVQADASEYEQKHTFDLVISKAAGRFGKLLPVAEGLLRMGGSYCTVKGTGSWKEELEEPGADRLTLEYNEPAHSGGGRLFWFSKEGGTGAGP